MSPLTWHDSPDTSTPVSAANLNLLEQVSNKNQPSGYAGLGTNGRLLPGLAAASINLSDYGAVGDLSHDDTTNVQDAVNNAIANGVEIIGSPGKSYKITAPIVVNGATEFHLNELCQICQYGQDKQVFDVTELAEGFAVYGGHLVASYTKRYFGNPNYRGQAGYNQSAGVWLGKAPFAKVKGTRFTGFIAGVFANNWSAAAGQGSGYIDTPDLTELSFNGVDFGVLSINSKDGKYQRLSGVYAPLSQSDFIYQMTGNGTATVVDAVTVPSGGGPAYQGQLVTGTGIPANTFVLSRVLNGDLVTSTIVFSNNIPAGVVTAHFTGPTPNPGHILYMSENSSGISNSPDFHIDPEIESISGYDSAAAGNSHVASLKGINGGYARDIYGRNCNGVATIRGCQDFHWDGFECDQDQNDAALVTNANQNGSLYIQGDAGYRQNTRVKGGKAIIRQTIADSPRAVRADGVDCSIDELRVEVNRTVLSDNDDVVFTGDNWRVGRYGYKSTQSAGGARAFSIWTGGAGGHRVRIENAKGFKQLAYVQSGPADVRIEYVPSMMKQNSTANIKFFKIDEPTALVYTERAINLNSRLYMPQAGLGWRYNSAAVPTAGRRYYVRFSPERDVYIYSFTWWIVTAAGSNDGVDAAIYDASGNVLIRASDTNGSAMITGLLNPGNARTSSVPLVAGKVTGFQALAGLTYYAAWACSAAGTTAATIGVADLAADGSGKLLGQSIGTYDYATESSPGPLPNAMPSSPGGALQFPFLLAAES